MEGLATESPSWRAHGALALWLTAFMIAIYFGFITLFAFDNAQLMFGTAATSSPD